MITPGCQILGLMVVNNAELRDKGMRRAISPTNQMSTVRVARGTALTPAMLFLLALELQPLSLQLNVVRLRTIAERIVNQ